MPLLVTRYPDVPWEALLATSAAVLGVGEVAQRKENAKTTAALHETSPYDEAMTLQAALRELELRH